MNTLRRFVTSRITIAVAALLLGALITLAIRFVTYAPEKTHYHANFAVYLNGTREPFSKPKYYQEVTICSVDGAITTPQQRVHLHDGDNSAVHVHDHAVTWGDLFTNLGWSVGADFIATDDGRFYKDDDTNKVSLILNGDPVTDVASINNHVIGDRDRLLVSFGPSDSATLQKQYASVPSTAAKYDTTSDPASCGSDAPVTFDQRIAHLF